MLFRNPNSLGGVALEVEFDQDRWLFANDTAIVSGLDDDYLWCSEIERASVGEGHVDAPAGEEADVSVHARLGAYLWLDVLRPMKAYGIDRAFYAGVSGTHDVEFHSAEYLVLRPGDWCEKGIFWIHCVPPQN
jgi:hypothetical protein